MNIYKSNIIPFNKNINDNNDEIIELNIFDETFLLENGKDIVIPFEVIENYFLKNVLKN